MSFHIRFRRSISTSVAVILVSMGGGLVQAQTSTTIDQIMAPVSSGAKPTSASFLVAPVITLKDVPSSVVTADLNGDGKPDLVVASATTGTLSVYLGMGKGKFSAGADYSVGGHPSTMVAADINGDGIKDIVTANGADGTVSVLQTIAGGKLATAHIYAVGVDANLLSIGDLNDDGKQDIIVGSQTAKSVGILLNDGQGNLKAPSIQALGKIPSGIVTGDFNGDGHIDAVIISVDGSIDALLGGGDGTLKLTGSLHASKASLSSAESGDFNGDGKLDLAITDADARTLTVYLGRGDGGFSKGSSYKVGNGVSSVVAMDANGDGVVDLVAVNRGSNTLGVLIGIGDGSFRVATDFAVGDGPVAVAAADFYGSGHVGLAVVNTSAKNLNVIAGNGDGSFRAASSYSGDLNPRAIASGDLNGDGIQDIVVTNFCGADATCGAVGTLSVYLGKKGGGYQLTSTQPTGMGPISVALADVNGDRILDVVTLNRNDKSLSVMLGVGDGTLQAPTRSSLVGSPVGLVAKDLDKDGKVDLAIISDCGSSQCSQRGSVDTYFGLGDGTFRFGASTPVNYSPVSIVAGDLNGDGVLDLAVVNACGRDASCKSAGTATVLLGAAQGSFVPQSEISLNNRPSAIAVRATSGSGFLDLVVTHEADNTVAVLPGNGDGTFKSAALYPVGGSPRSLVVADFNGDGKPDVAVANVKDSTVSVLYGQADGTLMVGDAYAVAAGPEALTSVASTANARASLVTANGNSASSSPGSEITSLSNVSPSDVTSTSINLTITSTSGTVNSAFTLQATISPAPPDGETISFSSDDGSALSDCTNPATITSGVASCTTSQLTAGSRTLTASYNGDSDFASASTSQTQTVNAVAATISLSGITTSPVVNQTVTYTATLGAGSGSFSPTVPSGMVSFTISGQSGASCANVTLSGGATTANCTFTAVSAGPISVAANYGNDNNFTVATPSNTVSQTVGAAAATISLAGPATAPSVNQSVTYTATLVSASFSPTVPSGTVSFTITGQSGASCANVTLSGGGTTASCTITAVAAGPISVTASYGSDNNFTASAISNTVNQSVSSVAATIALTGSTPSPTVNQSVTYVATLGAGSSSFSPTVPTGTVSFTISGQVGATCPSVILSGGTITASCTFTAASAGPVSVAASYGNDTNFTTSASSNTVSQTVNQAPVTPTLVGPTTSPVVNQSVTYTVTLAAGTGSFAPTVPSGIVSFAITGQTGVTPCASQPVTLVNGSYTATCTFSTVAAGTVSVTGTYANDSNFIATGAGSVGPLVVTKTPVTVSLAGPPTTPSVNQSITYTATLGAGSGSFSPTAPSGTVTFAITGQTGVTPCPDAPVTVTNGTYKASCTFTTVVAGSVSVTATYGSDANFVASSPGTSGSLSVNLVTTNLTISPTTPSSVNTAVMFTATIGSPSSGAAFMPTVPGGTVSFTANNTAITGCQAVAVMNRTAVCTTSSLTTFANTIMATYTGDTSYTASTSPTVTQSVNPIAATTMIAADSASALVNQPVNFTATVQGSNPGPVVPEGTVAFTQGVNTLCTASLNRQTPTATAATASCLVAFTGVNPGYAVTAMYRPTGTNFTQGTAATSPAVPVGATSTTVLLSTPIPSPSVVDQSVSFTAAVAPLYPSSPAPANLIYYPSSTAAVPVGSISFMDQSASPTAAICSATVASSTNGNTATCSSTALALGSHVLQAVFVPTTTSANFTGTTPSNTVTQVVGPAPVSLSLVPSNLNPSVNQSVTLTPSLSPTYTGSFLPNGTLTVTDAATSLPICVLPVKNGLVQACMVAFTTVGQHSLSAAYSADANFTGNSVSVNEVVSTTTTTTKLTISNSAPSVNAPVTFNVTVTPTFTGTATPSGTVSLSYDMTNALCTVNLSNAAGSCVGSFLTQGSHTVIATYLPPPGDSTFQSSPSTSSTVMVGQSATTVGISSISPNPSSVNQAATFTANVTRSTSDIGQTPPTGTVSFLIGTTTLCSAQLSSTGAATCMSLLGAAQVYQVAARYNGDTNFISSTSSAVTQAVSKGATAISVTPATTTITATQSVTFTATLSSASLPSVSNPTGTVMPSGTITFTTPAGTAPSAACASAALTGSPATGFTATCQVTFPVGLSTSFAVTATYNGDTNFSSSATSAPAAQTVKDFLLIASSAQPVFVTQGYTNQADPFRSTTPAIALTAINGFADSLSYACSVAPSGTGLSCSIQAASGTPTLLLTAASTATVGAYTATVTATDPSTASGSTVLTRFTPIAVQLGANISSVNVTSGASAAVQVPFPTGLSLSASNFTCAVKTIDNKTDPSNFNIRCSVAYAPSTGIASVTVTTGGTSSASLARPVEGKWLIVTCITMPFLLFAGKRRAMIRKQVGALRILGIAGVIVCALQTTGCGGGFTTPTVSSTTTAANTYLVDVTATATTGTYHALLNLVVN